MQDIIHAVRSQIIPTLTGSAVVPNRAIAEIVPISDIKAIPNAPVWLPGIMKWRNVNIPILSIDNFSMKQPVELNKKRTNIVVMNSSPANSGINFFGIVSTGVPRLVEVNATSIKVDREKRILTNYIKCNVNLDVHQNKVEGYLLDIPYVETSYRQAAKELGLGK